MTAYLRLLLIRTIRAGWGTGALAPGVGLPLLFFLVRGASGPATEQASTEATRSLASVSVLVFLGTGIAIANLTAYLVHVEKQRDCSRLLRVASVDGLSPVAAYVCHGALLAAIIASAGLLTAVAAAFASGVFAATLPPALLYLPLIAGIFGPLGLWLGYLLPRGMALMAIQPTAIWLAAQLGTELIAEVAGTRAPWGLLATMLLVYLVTLGILPLIWKLTSGRLW